MNQITPPPTCRVNTLLHFRRSTTSLWASEQPKQHLLETGFSVGDMPTRFRVAMKPEHSLVPFPTPLALSVVLQDPYHWLQVAKLNFASLENSSRTSRKPWPKTPVYCSFARERSVTRPTKHDLAGEDKTILPIIRNGGRRTHALGDRVAIFHTLILCTDNVQQKEIGPCEFR